MRRLASLTLTGLCLLIPPAAEGATQPPLELMTYSEWGISALDAYRGYYELPHGTLNFVNVRAGSTRTVVLPEDCTHRGISGPDILLLCPDAPTARVWNGWTRATTPVDVTACGEAWHRIALGGLGRYWIAGREETGMFDGPYRSPVDYPVYINRRTGECRYAKEFGRDLDSADLRKPRYGLPDKCSKGKKYIVRIGKRRGTNVKLCRARARWRFATGADLVYRGPTLLAWMGRTHVNAYLVESGRRLSWRVPGVSGDPYGPHASPAVIGDRVFVDLTGDDPRGVPIYVADLSGVVRRDRRLGR